MAVRVAAVLLIGAVCGTFPCAALAQPADPLQGRTVREIHITGLRKVSTDSIERQLATRVGEPFRRANLTLDRRRLDELRLFTTVVLEPRLDGDAVVLDVALTETLRLLPVVVLRVTDENGVSIGPGIRGINLFGQGTQSSVSSRFGGETGIAATIDATTIAPGTWLRHVGFSYTDRQNTLYDFDERATSTDARFGRNWTHGVRTGVAAELLHIDTGDLRRVAFARRQRPQPDGWRLSRHSTRWTPPPTRDTDRGPRSKSIACSATPTRGRSSSMDADISGWPNATA